MEDVVNRLKHNKKEQSTVTRILQDAGILDTAEHLSPDISCHPSRLRRESYDNAEKNGFERQVIANLEHLLLAVIVDGMGVVDAGDQISNAKASLLHLGLELKGPGSPADIEGRIRGACDKRLARVPSRG